MRQLIDDENLSVIVSTAYMDEAKRCAQVFVMHQGRLLAEGAPARLTRARLTLPPRRRRTRPRATCRRA